MQAGCLRFFHAWLVYRRTGYRVKRPWKDGHACRHPESAGKDAGALFMSAPL